MRAYLQRSIPNPLSTQYFAYSDFSGGLNNKKGYIEIDDNESISMLNVDVFKEDGVIWQRGGSEHYDALDLGSSVTLFDEFKLSTSKIMRGSSTELYADGDKVADLNSSARGVNFNEQYLYVDGAGMYAYGTFPQASSTYVSIVGTPTTNYITMEVKGEEASYTPLDLTHSIGVTVYDYNNNEIYYNPCQAELNDEFKGVNFPSYKGSLITEKEGRIYVSGDEDLPYTIFISDIRNPYYFPVSLGLQISPNGDEIVGMHEFFDTMIIGTKNKLHAIYGNTNRTDISNDIYIMKDLNVHSGFAGGDCISRVYNYLYYLGNDGEVYSLYTPQTDTDNIMTKSMTGSKIDIFDVPLSISKESLSSAVSVFYEDYFYLSIDELVLVFSFKKQAWQVYDSWGVKSWLVMGGDLLFGRGNGRSAKYVEESPNDFDEAINCYWQSKRFDKGLPSMIKRWFDMYLIVHTFDDYESTVSVSIEIDYQDLESVLEVKNRIAKWGIAVFGDLFIRNNINRSLPIPINRRGRLISFKFGNNVVDEKIRIYEVNGRYSVRGFR